MKVIGLNGSARRDGNTAMLLRRVLAELEQAGIETELIQLAGQPLEPCRACWACGGKGNCVHRRDRFSEVFEKVKAADGLILGSPVYGANVSSTMQAFLERAAVVCDMNPGLLAHKAGGAVAAARRGGAMTALDAMHRFFLNHEMFVAGASYWPMAYGQLPGDVEQDQEGMETMGSLGRNLVRLLRGLEK